MSRKILSIILPVFNNPDIGKAIDSICLSDEIELIVVDGGSDELTLEAIDSYVSRIDTFVSEKDQGLYDAMNKGIKLSSGDWILTLASDDVLLCNPVEIIKKYEKTGCKIITGNLLAIDNMQRLFEKKAESDLNQLELMCSLSHPATLFKRDVYDSIGLYNLKYRCAADRELFLRAYRHEIPFCIVNETMTFFNYGGISTKKPMIAFREDYYISREYNVSLFRTRKYFVERIIRHYGSAVKDALGLKHRTTFFDSVKLNEYLAQHPEIRKDILYRHIKNFHLLGTE